ncbi:hypothetical protein B1C78_14300 [Thioalkalivibrio denitrificans]|uniref:DUF3147 family protein n=1 Tax=Thioalkalivibrio denitrificans TaxID=108003 RepID=A0A1V3NC94_9GAMM|nr:DUF3147 family protein [Thioalkalivibrio denitrificans]OOG22700.1 hypothetical protein B1C78_14300 [Thioalkalivibrio denitrificans]
MTYYIARVLISAILIVVISEVAKRSSLAGAVIASLPVVSILAFLWIYVDTGDVQRIAELSQQIFWLVLASLVLFVTLPLLIRNDYSFLVALLLSIVLTSGGYLLLVWILKGRVT